MPFQQPYLLNILFQRPKNQSSNLRFDPRLTLNLFNNILNLLINSNLMNNSNNKPKIKKSKEINKK